MTVRQSVILRDLKGFILDVLGSNSVSRKCQTLCGGMTVFRTFPLPLRLAQFLMSASSSGHSTLSSPVCEKWGYGGRQPLAGRPRPTPGAHRHRRQSRGQRGVQVLEKQEVRQCVMPRECFGHCMCSFVFPVLFRVFFVLQLLHKCE